MTTRRDALVAELTDYTDQGGRVVLVSQHELPFPTVVLDNRGGAAALAHELVGLGYRGFALLAGPEGLVTARDRVEAFTAALGEHGIRRCASSTASSAGMPGTPPRSTSRSTGSTASWR